MSPIEVAYSDVCTHMPCAVFYEGQNKRLYCPCHEGVYDPATGEVVAGPPPRPLPLIQLAIRDGTIYVNFGIKLVKFCPFFC